MMMATRIVLCAMMALAGCAHLTNTPQQDFARAAWDSCPRAANIELIQIEPSGRINYRWVNSNSGAADIEACLAQYYATHPQPK